MTLDRRAFLGGISAAALAPSASRAVTAADSAIGAAAEPDSTVTVTDSAGRAVIVPKRMARVLPAGPPASIVLYTLAPDMLLGWTNAHKSDVREFLTPDTNTRPEIGRLTGRGNTANLEQVLALKPDLILDVGYVAGTDVALAERVQQQTGIPYALLDGHFPAIASTYRTLGQLTGRGEDAEKLARYADDTMKTITGRIATVPSNKRPRVYYARGPRGLDTGLGGSINVETIAFVGARNVAAERRGGLASVSLEQVLLWNPDVIVTIDRDFAAHVHDDPAWAAVAAVRAGRVHLSPRLPFPWVDFPPSVNRLIGLWWLSKILYPDLFPEDIRPLTRDFYALFYHVTLTDAQIERILAGGD